MHLFMKPLPTCTQRRYAKKNKNKKYLEMALISDIVLIPQHIIWFHHGQPTKGNKTMMTLAATNTFLPLKQRISNS